jgi:hypothetical protein
MPLPFRSIENAVTMCAAVPKPIVAPIEQHLPVRLRLERDVEPLVLEVAELVRNRERRHVGELDEAELELVLLERGRRRERAGGRERRGREGRPHDRETASVSHRCSSRKTRALKTKTPLKLAPYHGAVQRRRWAGPALDPSTELAARARRLGV